MESILGLLATAAVPGYFAFQIYTARKWDGSWRWAALAPALVMAPLIAFTIFAFAAGSNLWPLDADPHRAGSVHLSRGAGRNPQRRHLIYFTRKRAVSPASSAWRAAIASYSIGSTTQPDGP